VKGCRVDSCTLLYVSRACTQRGAWLRFLFWHCLVAGLANTKTIDVAAGEDGALKITKTRPKNWNKPLSAKNETITKKNVRRALQSVQKELAGFRPDLKVCCHPCDRPRLRWCTE
jgi:Ribosomal L28e protein family